MSEPIFTIPKPVVVQEPETFAPTPALRWRWCPKGSIAELLQVRVLQQAWQGSLGTVEWRDVETVEEKL